MGSSKHSGIASERLFSCLRILWSFHIELVPIYTDIIDPAVSALCCRYTMYNNGELNLLPRPSLTWSCRVFWCSFTCLSILHGNRNTHLLEEDALHDMSLVYKAASCIALHLLPTEATLPNQFDDLSSQMLLQLSLFTKTITAWILQVYLVSSQKLTNP